MNKINLIFIVDESIIFVSWRWHTDFQTYTWWNVHTTMLLSLMVVVGSWSCFMYDEVGKNIFFLHKMHLRHFCLILLCEYSRNLSFTRLGGKFFWRREREREKVSSSLHQLHEMHSVSLNQLRGLVLRQRGEKEKEKEAKADEKSLYIVTASSLNRVVVSLVVV